MRRDDSRIRKGCRRSRRHSWGKISELGSVALPMLLFLAFAPGCTMVKNVLGVKEQLAMTRELGRVEGVIDVVGGATGTLVVVIATRDKDGSGSFAGVDSYVRVRAGSYAFPVSAGRYAVGAYEDRNRNGLLDPGELVKRVTDAREFDLGAGEVVTVDIHLSADGDVSEFTEPVNVFEIIARSLEEQNEYSLWAWSKKGALRPDLEHPDFGPDAGNRGLWKFRDFLNEGLAGIYFLEEYDPDRIPVLYVHGIAGYPQEFTTLIDELDRRKFQPWFYFYPSGYSLDGISTHLKVLLSRVQVELDFDEIAIVAHSMGGLVSRGAILKYQEETHRKDIRLLVSISTPWNGTENAGNATEAKIDLPLSFADMASKSEYLRWIFWKDADRTEPHELIDETEFHMIFGYHMRTSGPVANDGMVSVLSQTRHEAIDRALSRWPYDYDHRDILSAPEVVDRLKWILQDRFD